MIAIPAADDCVFLVSYLGLFGHLGHAFGIVRGKHRRKPLSAQWRPHPDQRPFFTDLEAIASGRWSIIAQRPDWLTLFPVEPEYYHCKIDLVDDDAIGPFGCAETAGNYENQRDRRDVVDYSSPGETCVSRHLSEEEAREIGLLGNNFFQSGLEEQVEAYLLRVLR